MPDNFQQTVDLRAQQENKRLPTGQAGQAAPKTPLVKDTPPLEKIYREAGAPDKNLKKIDRPSPPRQAGGSFRLAVFLLAIVLVGASVYFLFFRRHNTAVSNANIKNWYAVKLVDGTVYYGRILDLKAEPVVINSVYYNYDQAKLATADKNQVKTIEETGNIRLVKRGQETQGGDGSVIAYHVNILVMEAMKSDSKVLKAILANEK
jgi:hypothetical protein